MDARVAQQSMCDIISLYFAPAGILPGAHMMPGVRKPPSNVEPFSPRNGVTPASGQASCHAPLSAVMTTMVSGASARMVSMIAPMCESSSSIASEYLPEMRLSREGRVGMFGIVHLHEVHIHEERLIILRVLLDVFDSRLGLADVKLAEVTGLLVDFAAL